MMIGNDRLKPANSDLFGFSGEIVKVEGQIELPVLVGEPPCQAFTTFNFLVMRATSFYNAILGRPDQNLIGAVASPYHQKMKFIIPNGMGEVRGDQPQSRECYAMLPAPKNRSTYRCYRRPRTAELHGRLLRDNQIKMYESDIPKTSFITDLGTYYYRVMPFGLKNAGATYQRLVNKLFDKQICRNMEVYVDDMLVKSQSAQDHVSDLKETFQVLRGRSGTNGLRNWHMP
ncbi:uncharacterized protein LOC143865824 [Tasmannia lanceolata]|uniref:uncharacterized protein LOC143865824 n=1 Tax=Tasmannia lanceolata TaxID=3420 RepID=UPI0040645E40